MGASSCNAARPLFERVPLDVGQAAEVLGQVCAGGSRFRIPVLSSSTEKDLDASVSHTILSVRLRSAT
jgi:hypothetical protein